MRVRSMASGTLLAVSSLLLLPLAGVSSVVEPAPTSSVGYQSLAAAGSDLLCGIRVKSMLLFADLQQALVGAEYASGFTLMVRHQVFQFTLIPLTAIDGTCHAGSFHPEGVITGRRQTVNIHSGNTLEGQGHDL